MKAVSPIVEYLPSLFFLYPFKFSWMDTLLLYYFLHKIQIPTHLKGAFGQSESRSMALLRFSHPFIGFRLSPFYEIGFSEKST